MSDANTNGFFEFTVLRPGGLEAAAEEGRESVFSLHVPVHIKAGLLQTAGSSTIFIVTT